MHGWETRMLLKHYLERGVSKAALSRRFGVSRRTIHAWVAPVLEGTMVAGRCNGTEACSSFEVGLGDSSAVPGRFLERDREARHCSTCRACRSAAGLSLVGTLTLSDRAPHHLEPEGQSAVMAGALSIDRSTGGVYGVMRSRSFCEVQRGERGW